MATPIALICKGLFPSISTFETPPEAEIYRLRGVLLLRQIGTPQAEAEAWLQRALDVARHQEAQALELRAAMSLSRLWQQQGKREEARKLLAPIGGVSNVDIDGNNPLQIKAIGVAISTFETLPI